MKRLFLIFMATALLAAGCSTQVKSARSGAAGKLESGRKIMVAWPADGAYGDKTYTDSGRATAQRLKAALASRASMVSVTAAQANIQAAMSEGRADGCRYLIHPEITHWEPRRAALSGRPTRVGFFITVYDLQAGGKPVLQQNLRARGRIMTFVSQYPADMAEAMFRQFADEVF